MTILLAFLASLAAFLGGFITFRFRDKLHIILGLSAGTIIGAALFDLIPEAIELGEGIYHAEEVTTLVGLGFLAYLILDRVFSFHSHENKDEHGHDETSGSAKGSLGAASFCLHSLIDGLAIGLAFQASSEIGFVVSIAVIAHRFSDGINTIGVILRHEGGDRKAWGWLTAVAVAPIVGASAAFLIDMGAQGLSLLLAVFAGFFLYIGASDLIPEGHHSHSKVLTTLMTIVGAVLIYLIVSLAHI